MDTKRRPAIFKWMQRCIFSVLHHAGINESEWPAARSGRRLARALRVGMALSALLLALAHPQPVGAADYQRNAGLLPTKKAAADAARMAEIIKRFQTQRLKGGCVTSVDRQGLARLYDLKDEEGRGTNPPRSGYEGEFYKRLKEALAGGERLDQERLLELGLESSIDKNGQVNLQDVFLTIHNVTRLLARPETWWTDHTYSSGVIYDLPVLGSGEITSGKWGPGWRGMKNDSIFPIIKDIFGNEPIEGAGSGKKTLAELTGSLFNSTDPERIRKHQENLKKKAEARRNILVGLQQALAQETDSGKQALLQQQVNLTLAEVNEPDLSAKVPDVKYTSTKLFDVPREAGSGGGLFMPLYGALDAEGNGGSYYYFWLGALARAYAGGAAQFGGAKYESAQKWLGNEQEYARGLVQVSHFNGGGNFGALANQASADCRPSKKASEPIRSAVAQPVPAVPPAAETGHWERGAPSIRWSGNPPKSNEGGGQLRTLGPTPQSGDHWHSDGPWQTRLDAVSSSHVAASIHDDRGAADLWYRADWSWGEPPAVLTPGQTVPFSLKTSASHPGYGIASLSMYAYTGNENSNKLVVNVPGPNQAATGSYTIPALHEAGGPAATAQFGFFAGNILKIVYAYHWVGGAAPASPSTAQAPSGTATSSATPPPSTSPQGQPATAGAGPPPPVAPITSPPAPATQVDPIGTWRHDPNGTWTITATSGGQYVAQETGLGNARGTGSFTPAGTFRIDYTTRDGTITGSYEVRFAPDGRTATGTVREVTGPRQTGPTTWTRVAGAAIGATPPTASASSSGTPPPPTHGPIVNLALHKPATQSSIYQGTGIDQGPQFGNDGIRDSQLRDPYLLVITGADNPPWWQVDLEGVHTLTQLKLYNRKACCQEKAKTVQVLLSTDGTRWERAYAHNGTAFDVLTVDLTGRSARYVRIQLAERVSLHFQECEVYGY